MISTVGCFIAAPATASTLSSDIDTSAMTICHAACANVLRGAPLPMRAVLVEVGIGQRFGCLLLLRVADADLAPHLPADPKQQKTAANQQERPDLQQPGRRQGKADAQHGGCDDADQDGALALVGRQSRRRETDDDGVVAGERDVDRNDRKQGAETGGGEYFHQSLAL